MGVIIPEADMEFGEYKENQVNADKSWIVPLQDVFRKELKAEMHIWKIPDFIILNEEQARKKHLII